MLALSAAPRPDYSNSMTLKRTKPVGLQELWEFEDRHPVVFASPRALSEARLIAAMERVQGNNRRHSHGKGISRPRRKPGNGS